MSDTFTLGVKRIPFNAEMRKARLYKRLTQGQLSEIIGVKVPRINKIELMKTFPSETEAYRIADALEVDVKILFPRWMQDKLIPQHTHFNAYFTVDKLTLENKNVELLVAPNETEHEIDHDFLKEGLANAILTLSEKEQKVLKLRFGLDDGIPRTYEEVGKEFGVTRERIRQIETKALRKIKRPLRETKKVLAYEN